MITKDKRFSLGNIYFSCGVNALANQDISFSQFVLTSINRHVRGDWGELCKEDIEENELSLREGFRLLSAYSYRDKYEIWIITEADRSATTVLFPYEY